MRGNPGPPMRVLVLGWTGSCWMTCNPEGHAPGMAFAIDVKAQTCTSRMNHYRRCARTCRVP